MDAETPPPQSPDPPESAADHRRFDGQTFFALGLVFLVIAIAQLVNESTRAIGFSFIAMGCAFLAIGAASRSSDDRGEEPAPDRPQGDEPDADRA